MVAMKGLTRRYYQGIVVVNNPLSKTLSHSYIPGCLVASMGGKGFLMLLLSIGIPSTKFSDFVFLAAPVQTGQNFAVVSKSGLLQWPNKHDVCTCHLASQNEGTGNKSIQRNARCGERGKHSNPLKFHITFRVARWFLSG